MSIAIDYLRELVWALGLITVGVGIGYALSRIRP